MISRYKLTIVPGGEDSSGVSPNRPRKAKPPGTEINKLFKCRQTKKIVDFKPEILRICRQSEMVVNLMTIFFDSTEKFVEI